jgi:reverse gyrase
LDFFHETLAFNGFNKKAISLLHKVNLTSTLDRAYELILEAWGLKLSAPQRLLCNLVEIENFLVINPGLGMGKSTFIQVESIHKASNEQGSLIIILNSDDTLLVRDY